MVKETVCLASKTVELAEHPSYIELKNLLCYYDEPNENGVQLPSKDALEKAETLVDMPVVAKYRLVNGKPDLGGHEAYYDTKTKEVNFGTDTIGTHQSVSIEEAEIDIHGETKKLPCLYAVSRVWTRNKNVSAAIKRLFEEGKLTSSWEIGVNAYDFRDGVKILTDYYFEANCLLGSNVLPAYPCAKVTDLSTLEQSQLMVAEAFIKDKEDDMLKDKEQVNTENAEAEANVTTEEIAEVIDEIVEEAPATSEVIDEEADDIVETSEDDNIVEPEQVETSQLTIRDLRMQLNKLCDEALKPSYGWVCYIVVDEQYCLVDYAGSNELEFYKFDYTIENGEVSISNAPEKVTLLVSVDQINSAISSRDEAILSKEEQIKELSARIQELEPYKEQIQQIEAEKAEQEKQLKITELKSLATTGGYISEDEIENDETIKEMISSLNEAGIKSLIVDRMISQNKASKVEISTSTTDAEVSKRVRTDLVAEEEDMPINKVYVNSRKKK